MYIEKARPGARTRRYGGQEPTAMGATKHPTNITPYGVYGVVHGKVQNQLVCVCVAVFVCVWLCFFLCVWLCLFVHILNIPL